MILSKSYTAKKGDKIPLYGLKRAIIRIGGGYASIKIGDSVYNILPSQFTWEFPIIDGKSPKFAEVLNNSDGQLLTVSIFELGGVPSDDYGKEVK